MSEGNPLRVQLFMVRLGHPHLYKPKGFGKNNDNPARSAKFYIPKDTPKGKRNIEAIEDAMDAAMEKGKTSIWKGKLPKIKKDNKPFYDGDDDDGGEREVKPEEEGMMVLRTRSYKVVRVLDADKEPAEEGEDGAPYGGCYVDAIVEFWPQDYEGVPRLNCEIKGVRFRKDGEPFSGDSPIGADDFRDDDEDEKPKRRSRDDDEDEKPKRRSRDDDEDEKPKRRSRDDDEEPPKRRGRDDDEDERPARRRSRDDDDEDAPRRRRSRDDDVA